MGVQSTRLARPVSGGKLHMVIIQRSSRTYSRLSCASFLLPRLLRKPKLMESFDCFISLTARLPCFSTCLCDFLTCLVLYVRELRKSMNCIEEDDELTAMFTALFRDASASVSMTDGGEFVVIWLQIW